MTSHSTNIGELTKKVRRIFSGRTHKFDLPKFTVVQDKNLRNERVIVAPYDKTVEKIERLVTSDRLALLDRLYDKIYAQPTWENSTMIEGEEVLATINAEREAIQKGLR